MEPSTQLSTDKKEFKMIDGTTRTIQWNSGAPPLGKGGFGKVFFATDVEDPSQHYAVKIIKQT